jgi:hypothetical protein
VSSRPAIVAHLPKGFTPCLAPERGHGAAKQRVGGQEGVTMCAAAAT